MQMQVRYTIQFEPVQSARFRAPPVCRLKGLLKTSLRAWGMRVVSAREEPVGREDRTDQVVPGRAN